MKHLGFAFLVLILAACNRSESETASATDTGTATATASAESTGPASDTASAPSSDLAFATTASMANLYEITASQLALQKATGATYKEFAQTMITQHTEIGESYKPIAEKQGLPMPAALEGEFKTLYDALAAAQSGAAFDNLYRQQRIPSSRPSRRSGSPRSSIISRWRTHCPLRSDPAIREHDRAPAD
jgi:predicted outer membrane protein